QMTVQAVQNSATAGAKAGPLTPDAATQQAAQVVDQWTMFSPAVLKQATAGLLAPQPAAGPSAAAVAKLYSGVNSGKVSAQQLHQQLVAWLGQAYPDVPLTALLSDPRNQDRLVTAYTQIAENAPSMQVQQSLSTDLQAGILVDQALATGTKADQLRTLLTMLPTQQSALQTAVLGDGRVSGLLDQMTSDSAAKIDSSLDTILKNCKSAPAGQRQQLLTNGLSVVAKEVAPYEVGGLTAGSPGRASVATLLTQPLVQQLMADAKAQGGSLAALAPLLQAARPSAALSTALYAEAAPGIRRQLSGLNVTDATGVQNAAAIYTDLSEAASALPSDTPSLLGQILPGGALPKNAPYLASGTALLNDYRGQFAAAVSKQITNAPTTKEVMTDARFATDETVETAQGQTQDAFVQAMQQAVKAGDGGLFGDLVTGGADSRPVVASNSPASGLIWRALGEKPPAKNGPSDGQDPTGQALAAIQQIDGIRFQAATSTSQLTDIVGSAYSLPPDAAGGYAADTRVFGTTTIGDIVSQLQKAAGANATNTSPVIARAAPLLINDLPSAAFEVQTAGGTKVVGPDGQVYSDWNSFWNNGVGAVLPHSLVAAAAGGSPLSTATLAGTSISVQQPQAPSDTGLLIFEGVMAGVALVAGIATLGVGLAAAAGAAAVAEAATEATVEVGVDAAAAGSEAAAGTADAAATTSEGTWLGVSQSQWQGISQVTRGIMAIQGIGQTAQTVDQTVTALRSGQHVNWGDVGGSLAMNLAMAAGVVPLAGELGDLGDLTKAVRAPWLTAGTLEDGTQVPSLVSQVAWNNPAAIATAVARAIEQGGSILGGLQGVGQLDAFFRDPSNPQNIINVLQMAQM
ncbi:MAG: hypothetical protein FWD50_08605, partial [Betaproteobacteria bacterium]|nr:hypothetical protein [Betaproteobacteria bacterium]